MADPRVPQGNLNRLKASLIWNDHPQLNVTPAYLAREMLVLAFEGTATGRIPTSTGVVNSPEPFQPVMITANLLKTQFLAALYETQRQNNSLLGSGTIRPDVASNSNGIGPYEVLNMSIDNVRELAFDGSTPVFSVTMGGYMLINSFLWD